MNALENLEAKGWQVTAWRTTWECLEVGVLLLLDVTDEMDSSRDLIGIVVPKSLVHTSPEREGGV